MYGNINKLNKELNKKKVNICTKNNHIITKEEINSQKGLKSAYDELKIYDWACFADFLEYEKWLEDCTGGHKKR